MREHDRADALIVRTRTALGELGLLLLAAGERHLEEHPDEMGSEPDVLDVIAAGCQYLRDHPEARSEIGRRTPGGQHDG